jgi:hypothetical protein
VLHVGDQFLNTGNDYAARDVCPCVWIVSPTETRQVTPCRQPSPAISHQPSAISLQPSVISHQPSATSHQYAVISMQPSAISHQPSVFSH